MNNNNKNININLSNGELSALIGDIYDAPLTGRWTEVLDKIIDFTQSNKAFFVLQKLNEPKPLLLEFQTTFDHCPNVLKDYNARFKEDPFYKVTKVATEGESLNLSDYIDLAQLKNTKYYQDLFVPMKSYHCLAGILIRDGEYDSAYAINRGENDEPYSLQDFNLFKLLTPHMSRAATMFKVLKLYKNYANISKSILDQSDKAIVVCDENARVIFSNSFANSKIEKIEQVNFSGEKLRLSNAIYNKQLHQYIKHCASLSFNQINSQETIIIDDFVDSENILLTVSPLNNHNSMNDIDVPCCMVTISFQKVLNWPLVAREFKLTDKELQLLKAIYSKKKLNELTCVFEVTYNTLRSHLQAIFKKTLVNSQTELMMKLNMFKS